MKNYRESEFGDPPNRRRAARQVPELIMRYLAGFLWAGLIVTCIGTSYYTVPADSEAVVQRFGQYHGTQGPGLHFKMPFGVDHTTVVPIRRQLKLEFGFGTPQSSNPHQNDPQVKNTKDMVTGDLNEAQVEWVVQYRISDSQQFLFAVQDPEDTLRSASEAVMREVIGDRTIDEVITYGRQEIETENLIRLQPLAKQYSLGITVDLIQLKNINPPQAVQDAFNDVNRAQQEKQNAINLASGEYNQVIPQARGVAVGMISEAQGYATKRTNEAMGDASYFSSLLSQYLKAPEVTRQRIYLETMTDIMPRLGHKIVLDQDVSHFLPLLPLPAAFNAK